MSEPISENNDRKKSLSKEWLVVNKIYFETIAAFLLGIMAIVLSGSQLFISCQQNKLVEKQMEIANAELKNNELNYKINYVQNWNELKRLLRLAELHYNGNFNGGTMVKNYFKSMTPNEVKKWLDEFLDIIKQIGANRMIIENKALHENFLAIETRLLLAQNEFVYSKKSIYKDFLVGNLYLVWRHLFIIHGNVFRPRAYKDIEDSSYYPDVKDWQFGTDKLMKEIDSLSSKN